MKTSVECLLAHIRDNYERVKHLTESLDRDSSAEVCLGVFASRAGLLREIENDQKQLDSICKGWQKRCDMWPAAAAIRNEIQALISATIALDAMIQNYIIRKLECVKIDLSALGRTSKVALSYARHSM